MNLIKAYFKKHNNHVKDSSFIPSETKLGSVVYDTETRKLMVWDSEKWVPAINRSKEQ